MLAIQIKEATFNIMAAKLRSILALLGILVGTASVVAMVSCGALAAEAALKQFKQLGTGLMSVTLNPQGDAGNKSLQLFSLESANGLLPAVPELTAVAPYTSVYVPVRFEGKSLNATTIGSTEALAKVIKISVQKGRFISNLDGYQYFCLIGQNLFHEIKNIQGTKVIGKQIEVGHNIYTIVGVAKHWPENAFFYQDINNAIIVPILTSKVLSKYSEIRNIVFYLKPDVSIERVKTDVTTYLNKHVSNVDLFFRSAEQIILSMRQQSRIFTLLLGLIGSISLLVGGIGVMNIMLVSVVERRREIGIRKALGARKRDIQSLFLIESVTLSLIGGLLGVIVGVGSSYIIARFTGWDFFILWQPPVIGFLVSVAIGVLSGFYPAWKASRLDPIESLRTE